MEYSLPALKGILPFNHYNCWLFFVKACRNFCCRSLTLQQLNEADEILYSFCKKFVELYGFVNCTINLHLHCHLRECIIDYDPIYAFWLFSYEHLNGIFGNFHTNYHYISLQLMRKYLIEIDTAPHNWPSEYRDDFIDLIHSN